MRTSGPIVTENVNLMFL